MIGAAQVLLAVSAGALWVASRLPWVVIHSFDGLGPPRSATLSGASWSTALLPLALLLLAIAVAAVAVRGRPLRMVAVLAALASLVIGYLAISLWVIPDVAVRAADLAHVPVVFLVGSERHYAGATAALAAGMGTLMAGVLLMRSAAISGASRASKYLAPAARRSAAAAEDTPVSQRALWEALDEGRDPTDQPENSAGAGDHESGTESGTEGR
ncbi:MAG: TIGR02234 family membrane protein [Mycobacterium sp.]|uniref:TIGR02234 family membrane protein n=1 Tax=Mycobacterium sp. TaxID=1785 RepID=UPI002625EDDF|nr:TIGR02234 family membrane protein [Mycobacterium sp.]MDI3315694.1 TIGR02234 family membrane protein [Mycobacterium sp.]